MASATKTAANRANAQRSTGPKTAKGKTVTKLNAIAHGLRSVSPVIPGERPEDWEIHRAGIAGGLKPVGFLEADLAERVALLTWRMRRVVTYETEVTAHRISGAEARVRGEESNESFGAMFRSPTGRAYATIQKELHDERQGLAEYESYARMLREIPHQDDAHPVPAEDAFNLLWELGACAPGKPFDIEKVDFIAALGVPEEWQHDPRSWDGWTVRTIRKAVELITKERRLVPAEFLLRAERLLACDVTKKNQRVERLDAELASVEQATAEAMLSARSRSVLPAPELLDKIMRYESHLARQLLQTLHLLERLQGARSGSPPSLPAALDVTIETSGIPLQSG